MEKEKYLEEQIRRLEEHSEKMKFKRTIRTIVVCSIVVYIVLYILGEFQNSIDFLLGIPTSIFAGGIYFYINTFLFLPIMTGANRDSIAIEKLKAELSVIRNLKNGTYN